MRPIEGAGPLYEAGLHDRPRYLGVVLKDMAILVGCSRTFEFEHLRAKLAKLDAERAELRANT